MPHFIICWFRRLINLLNISWVFVRNIMSLNFPEQSDMESDDDCAYDSTWEDEVKIRKKKSHARTRRNVFAARDMQEFRHSCQDLDGVNPDELTSRNKWNERGGQTHSRSSYNQDDFYNLKFYKGLRRSEPDNLHIDDFHRYWFQDYERLETVHSYIQWLFPIQERGMNWQAHVLTKKEISVFHADAKARDNLLKSYKVMLDFYGIRLENENTGEVTRAANWKERFENLNRHTHNNLRITRILKCLGILGFRHYQAPLVRFFLIETLQRGTLPNVKESVLDYFMFSVLNKSERKELVRFAFELFQPQSRFVWGPRRILQGAAVNAHRENETACAAVNEPIDFGQNSNVGEGSITKQGRRGTPSPTRYTAEVTGRGKQGQKNKSTPSSHTEHQKDKNVNQSSKEMTGEEGSKKGSQVQVKPTPKSVTPIEQTTNENNDGGQDSQFSSNGAQVQEKKSDMEITPVSRNNEQEVNKKVSYAEKVKVWAKNVDCPKEN